MIESMGGTGSTSSTFDEPTVAMLERAREVRIETTSSDGSQTHRTVIWIVMIGDVAFIRSVRGARGRWYREALAHPAVVIHADGEHLSATAVLAKDADTIQAVSDAFRAKYGKRSPGSTAAMVAPHTLETTLRLDRRHSPDARPSGT